MCGATLLFAREDLYSVAQHQNVIKSKNLSEKRVYVYEPSHSFVHTHWRIIHWRRRCSCLCNNKEEQHLCLSPRYAQLSESSAAFCAACLLLKSLPFHSTLIWHAEVNTELFNIQRKCCCCKYFICLIRFRPGQYLQE